MNISAAVNSHVADHYARHDLVAAIRDGLARLGKTESTVTATMVETARPMVATSSANITVRRSRPSVRPDGGPKPEFSMGLGAKNLGIASLGRLRRCNAYENGPRSGRCFGPIAALPVWNEGVFVARVNEVLKARYSAAASGAGCQSMAT